MMTSEHQITLLRHLNVALNKLSYHMSPQQVDDVKYILLYVRDFIMLDNDFRNNTVLITGDPNGPQFRYNQDRTSTG